MDHTCQSTVHAIELPVFKINTRWGKKRKEISAAAQEGLCLISTVSLVIGTP